MAPLASGLSTLPKPTLNLQTGPQLPGGLNLSAPITPKYGPAAAGRLPLSPEQREGRKQIIIQDKGVNRGSVAGMQDFNAQIPGFPTMPGGGYGGGGGGGGGGGLYASGMDLVNDRRAAIESMARKAYENRIKDIEAGRGIIESETERARGAIEGQYGIAAQNLQQKEVQQKRVAQQGYQDAILQNRIRARALGSSGSGFLETASGLDQQLNQTLSDVRGQTAGALASADQVRLSAIGELEGALARAIASIESDKRLAAQERDKAITEAQLAAQEQAFDIQKWFASRSGGGGGGGGGGANTAAYMNNLQASALQQINAAKAAGASPEQIQNMMNQFEVASLQAGGSYGNISGMFNQRNPLEDRVAQEAALFPYRAVTSSGFGYFPGDVQQRLLQQAGLVQ